MGFVKYFLVYSVCMAALTVVVHGTPNCVQCGDYSTCNDPVNTAAVGVTTCSYPGYICARYSYKDKFGTQTNRLCVQEGTTCDYLEATNLLFITDSSSWKCYTCNSDLCNKENGANSFGVPVASLVLAALVNLYFK